MTVITRSAGFDPTDTAERILAAISCPACGYRDPSDIYRVTLANRVRFFCDGCGAFVTLLLSDAQADVVRHWPPPHG